MVELNAFLPHVMTEAPICPATIALSAIRDGCRAVAYDTWAVTEDLALTTTPGVQRYELVSIELEQEVFTASTVVLDSAVVLTPDQSTAVRRFIPSSGVPSIYWVSRNGLYLYTTPDRVHSVQVEGVIRPTRSATQVSELFMEHYDAVVAYAAYKILLGASVWQNLDRAVQCYNAYVSLTSEVRMQSSTGDVGAALRVSPRG